MPKVITVQDLETLLRSGAPVPEDALLTPSARDLLRSRASLLPRNPAKAAAAARMAVIACGLLS
ncbi:MAG TPA: class II aldolase/adducin family protein, partial [Opitutaceae bacterium]|nr:class II aldolase/adducin family protein [Opitutaceae bacterium]